MGFISNSSAAADISHNDSYLATLLAQNETSIQITDDVIISSPIVISQAKPFEIIGATPNARLISRYNGVPLQINSTFPSPYNPPHVQCTLANFTFIHAPSDSKAYSHIVAKGTNIGKYLNINNLTISHFSPLIVDEKYENTSSIYIENPAGLVLYDLYCHNLNTGGLHIKDGYKVTLNNYKGRIIVNNRPLTLESCACVIGDVYCEAFTFSPLIDNCKWSERGLQTWFEMAGYPHQNAYGNLLEVRNSKMGFYGTYGQDSNSIQKDYYSEINCTFGDLINPFGNLISSQLIGNLVSWPSEKATITANNLLATSFPEAGGGKVKFYYPSLLMQTYAYKPGDRVFVTGTIILDDNSLQFYQNRYKNFVDLPIFRVTMNDTDMGQNIYANGRNIKFRAEGKFLKTGTNPDIWTLFYGDKNNQLELNKPLKVNFYNVSLWIVSSY